MKVNPLNSGPLGATAKSPQGHYVKSKPQATTKLEDIRIQVGCTGALTPVAVLNQCNWVAPRFVTTLHNEDEVERLGVP